MKLYISSEPDRLTVAAVLLKNGYTVKSVPKNASTKEQAHLEITEKEIKEINKNV
jgi:hypothetical protein